ncbi:MAG TPA: hypothetical protein VK497_06075 [Candidatus Saccharimonadales bacterium]|nr:hypothetical protein [Candidatus Saccharimonadales bacterium]
MASNEPTLDQQYLAGRILEAEIEGILEVLLSNYKNGTNYQKALAAISVAQCDLFSGFLELLPNNFIFSRAIILRSILENYGMMIHIRDSDDRSKAFLSTNIEFSWELKNAYADINPRVEDKFWSSSSIKDRVKKVGTDSHFIYDLLSQFTHGNNVASLFTANEQADSIHFLIINEYLKTFVQFYFVLVHDLEISEKMRDGLYAAMEKASKIGIGQQAVQKS